MSSYGDSSCSIVFHSALELSDQQNIVASKTYETLQLQIWSLLPGFCTRPTDLAIVSSSAA
ncbi:hypothetical protein DPMN_166000 [Dreissena polymorpha]|uniref:RRP12 HEAT domain-containing protein n=1 Tax=Dreissena polymorpha TaxID=45954 RepID=A0A9D4EW08_DREPO|nr:hypothetical protein DPMN_166000 [Dreissena polymorpha]